MEKRIWYLTCVRLPDLKRRPSEEKPCYSPCKMSTFSMVDMNTASIHIWSAKVLNIQFSRLKQEYNYAVSLVRMQISNHSNKMQRLKKSVEFPFPLSYTPV